MVVDWSEFLTERQRKGEYILVTENFFNLEDLSEGIFRQLAEGITTHVFPGEQAMLSVVHCEADTTGSIHSHPEEQWGMCLEGSGVRIQDGIDVPFKRGDFWRTPGGVRTWHTSWARRRYHT